MTGLTRLFMALVLAFGSMFAISAGSASAAAPCVGKWDVVVGGLNNNDSQGFIGADQRVGYNSYVLRTGIDELKRLVRQHRSQCPGDHISMTGYSGGAAVVHVAARELGNIGRINAVLLSDPKEKGAPPHGPGFAATDPPFMFWPDLGGADSNFGGIPTFRDCRISDHICNSKAPWSGYPSNHGGYDLNVNAYSMFGNGLRYRP